MASKKERIEFLEAECETHRAALKELFEENKALKQELEELKKGINNQPPTIIREREYFPIPQPMQIAGSRCPNCSQWYFGTYHFCWCVPTTRAYPVINPTYPVLNPNGWWSVISTKTEKLP